VPELAEHPTTASTEVGAKFQASVAGYILGLRFFKGPSNTGVHVGKLWTKGGTSLASVQFVNETAYGWQEAYFPNPVAVAANTTYVMSYRAGSGHFSLNPNYFRTSSFGSGPLTALKDGLDGPNGVYTYNFPGMPDASSSGANYWVDVIFNTVPSPTPTVIPTKGNNNGASATMFSLGNAPVTDQAEQSAPVRTLSCTPRSVAAGGSFVCVASRPAEQGAVEELLGIDAGGSDVRLPASVAFRAGQDRIAFYGSVDPAATRTRITIQSGSGGDKAFDEIEVIPSDAPVLSVPQNIEVRPGDRVSFQVTAADRSGLPVQLSATDLPVGATFIAPSGEFDWIPTADQIGVRTPTFSAANSAGVKAAGKTRLVVEPGTPVITSSSAAGCSPGALLSLTGRWLSTADGDYQEPSGSSLNLAGTAVRVNGVEVPVLFTSRNRVDFLCPDGTAGESLNIVLQTEAGASEALRMTMQTATPTLLTTEEPASKQGRIRLAGTDRVASVRNYRGDGEPVLSGDLVALLVSGLGRTAGDGNVSVTIGDVPASVESIDSMGGSAGMHRIMVRVPAEAPRGNEVPVRVQLKTPGGPRLASNVVTMAIE
jgi:uncharacterized protein (TIGR03437 family)